MRVGVRLPNDSGPTASAIRAVATLAEECGYDSVWIDAHVVVPATITSRYPLAADGRPRLREDAPFPDPFTTLGFVAALTTRIRLGTGVVPFNTTDALTLAKRAATLDALSDGRLELGIGAGWLKEEPRALGRPDDHASARMEEGIDIMRAAWRHGRVEWRGRFHSFSRVGVFPRPPQGDGLPLWIGGVGREATRIARERGAGLMLSLATPEEAGRFRERLGDGAKALRLACSMPLVGSTEEWRDAARHYRDAGVDLVVIGRRSGTARELAELRAFASDVLPALR